MAERWIYTTCLCFALSQEEQERSEFHYQYSVYQGEYSRNLLFQRGARMEQVFQAMVDRSRASLGIEGIQDHPGIPQAPYHALLGQGVCDLSQGGGVLDLGKTNGTTGSAGRPRK